MMHITEARKRKEIHPDRVYNPDGTFRPSADDYMRAANVINMIRQSSTLSNDDKQALRLQALHGDVDGAWEAFRRLVQTQIVFDE